MGVIPGGGYATLTASLATAAQKTTTGEAGVGPFTVTTPAGSASSGSGAYSRGFTVQVRPTPPQPIEGPQVAFKVGKAAMEDGQEGTVSSWFRALPEGAKAAILNGKRTINVSGYASTTSRRRRNRDLSERRARAVEHMLRGFAGSNANINVFFFGEDAATTPDEREDPTWRRATVQVTAPNLQAAAPPAALPPGL